jgi:hypothetical protein
MPLRGNDFRLLYGAERVDLQCKFEYVLQRVITMVSPIGTVSLKARLDTTWPVLENAGILVKKRFIVTASPYFDRENLQSQEFQIGKNVSLDKMYTA